MFPEYTQDTTFFTHNKISNYMYCTHMRMPPNTDSVNVTQVSLYASKSADLDLGWASFTLWILQCTINSNNM